MLLPRMLCVCVCVMRTFLSFHGLPWPYHFNQISISVSIFSASVSNAWMGCVTVHSWRLLVIRPRCCLIHRTFILEGHNLAKLNELSRPLSSPYRRWNPDTFGFYWLRLCSVAIAINRVLIHWRDTHTHTHTYTHWWPAILCPVRANKSRDRVTHHQMAECGTSPPPGALMLLPPGIDPNDTALEPCHPGFTVRTRQNTAHSKPHPIPTNPGSFSSPFLCYFCITGLLSLFC